MFDKKLTSNYSEDTFDDLDAESIRFAWELENIDEVTDAAYKMIADSKNIVVIGYTFPLYNRLVDFKYLAIGNLYNKKLFIQDPNALELKEVFIEYFNLENVLNVLVKSNFFAINLIAVCYKCRY